MGAPKLHAVTSDEVAQPDPPAPPKTLVEATERSRREFLVMARRKIATEIDAGVPSHALGRLIAEMDRLDTEVRRMDACLLYTSDAADDLLCVDLGGRRIIKKKKKDKKTKDTK